MWKQTCLSVVTESCLYLNKCVCCRLQAQPVSYGRDLTVAPWEQQELFAQGYHYCPTLEDCQKGIDRLNLVDQEPKHYQYPDLRNVNDRFKRV